MTYKLTNTSQPADPYYGAVSLLLHGDGADGSTQIIDSSPNPKTVTAVGDAQISTTESKFNGSSLKFDGTGDYLTSPNNTGFSFGAEDFTIEVWFYIAGNSSLGTLTNTRTGSIISTESDAVPLDNYEGWILFVNGDASTTGTAISFIRRVGGGNAPTSITYTATITQSSWHHVAVTRSASSLRLFFNGSIVASDLSFTGSVNSSGVPLKIARRGFISGLEGELNGYIDDLRITKGVARYTSNFTPPGSLPTF